LGTTVDSVEKEKTSAGSCEQLTSPLCNFFGGGEQTPRAKMGLRADAAESRMKKKVEEGRLLL
jgi:hypothetical protein